MPLYKGGTKIKELYIGGTKIKELYKGSTKVFSGAWQPVWVGGTTLPENSGASEQPICYGNGKFVIVGTGLGTILTSKNGLYSTDGITWTQMQLDSSAKRWHAVCYGGDRFVATTLSILSFGAFYYSTDGINWTSVSVSYPSGSLPIAICYGNGRFVAVCEGSTDSTTKNVIYSSDSTATKWTRAANLPVSNDWKGIAYGNGKFVATANGIGAYSTDGIAWNQISSMPHYDGALSSVIFGDGKFVAFLGRTLSYSTNGTNWTETKTITDNYFRSICYGNGKFIATTRDGGQESYYSTDGINWKQMTMPEGSWVATSYGAGKFVAIKEKSTDLIYCLG